LLKIATRLPQLIRWIIHPGRFAVPPARRQGYGRTEPAEVLVSPDGLIYGFRPWEHIYSIGKLGKSPNIPVYNPYGKYVVRLFWLTTACPGRVRRCLLPMTARFLELWPALLTKALIKVAALDSATAAAAAPKEFGDFSPIHCLTGWLPQTIAV
uniref:Oxidored_molyb domain-containing protein n=1 Tax=Macrostomum lignano TaxID=282301 RepID=A0A1I8F8H9_9PLAT